MGAETIAEVFVRINGEGKKLNQADFIMTLMSVFWDEGRTELEKFARDATRSSDGQASSYNHFIRPAPDQMLRATIGLGLKRARLENVYAVLRGRDAVTGKDDPAKRDEQFALLAKAQDQALNLANWHHFLSGLKLAGYRSEKMISSQTAIIYSYVLYLIGICDFGIDKSAMRQAVAEFFFMAALTARYTSSPETRFESDLAQIRGIKTGEDYLGRLREMAGTVLTKDYWEITLPSALATSAARSPSLFAYQAALIKLDALALYGPIKIASLVDPAVSGTKSALEQHHLFPRGYLKTLDVTETCAGQPDRQFRSRGMAREHQDRREATRRLCCGSRCQAERQRARRDVFLACPSLPVVGAGLRDVPEGAPCQDGTCHPACLGRVVSQLLHEGPACAPFGGRADRRAERRIRSSSSRRCERTCIRARATTRCRCLS